MGPVGCATRGSGQQVADRQIDPLQRQQRPFDVELRLGTAPADAIAAQAAVARHDPMARDEQAHRAPTHRATDGPRRTRPPDAPGDARRRRTPLPYGIARTAANTSRSNAEQPARSSAHRPVRRGRHPGSAGARRARPGDLGRGHRAPHRAAGSSPLRAAARPASNASSIVRLSRATTPSRVAARWIGPHGASTLPAAHPSGKSGTRSGPRSLRYTPGEYP